MSRERQCSTTESSEKDRFCKCLLLFDAEFVKEKRCTVMYSVTVTVMDQIILEVSGLEVCLRTG